MAALSGVGRDDQCATAGRLRRASSLIWLRRSFAAGTPTPGPARQPDLYRDRGTVALSHSAHRHAHPQDRWLEHARDSTCLDCPRSAQHGLVTTAPGMKGRPGGGHEKAICAFIACDRSFAISKAATASSNLMVWVISGFTSIRPFRIRPTPVKNSSWKRKEPRS